MPWEQFIFLLGAPRSRDRAQVVPTAEVKDGQAGKLVAFGRAPLCWPFTRTQRDATTAKRKAGFFKAVQSCFLES